VKGAKRGWIILSDRMIPMSSPCASDVFRFAGFEIDRDRYQLRYGNTAVKLERIPLELLFLLLENRGKLVMREQIAARLWQDDSFLDTERSINTAVRKVRKALGDDPVRPQFLETVVGKGYRFIAPVAAEQDARLSAGSSMSGAAPDETPDTDTLDIRLQSFLVETRGLVPILTCDVTVGGMSLGRLPLLEVKLPEDMALPIKPEDRSLLKLHGISVALTERAAQALHAFSILTLQSGLRSRTNDFLAPKANSSEPTASLP
jgi:DNA-binding winged helix-turn-helix (wHTH) protein